MDIYHNDEMVKKTDDIITKDFIKLYNNFDTIIKSAGSMSCNWTVIPSFGKFYVPTADTTSMFSTEMY